MPHKDAFFSRDVNGLKIKLFLFDPLRAGCSICSKDYASSLGFTRNTFSDNTGGVVLLVVTALLAMVAFTAFLSYMMSVEMQGAGRGIVARTTRYIPLLSLKVVIVGWQILTQVGPEKRERFAFPGFQAHSCADESTTDESNDKVLSASYKSIAPNKEQE